MKDIARWLTRAIMVFMWCVLLRTGYGFFLTVDLHAVDGLASLFIASVTLLYAASVIPKLATALVGGRIRKPSMGEGSEAKE